MSSPFSVHSDGEVPCSDESLDEAEKPLLDQVIYGHEFDGEKKEKIADWIGVARRKLGGQPNKRIRIQFEGGDTPFGKGFTGYEADIGFVESMELANIQGRFLDLRGDKTEFLFSVSFKKTSLVYVILLFARPDMRGGGLRAAKAGVQPQSEEMEVDGERLKEEKGAEPESWIERLKTQKDFSPKKPIVDPSPRPIRFLGTELPDVPNSRIYLFPSKDHEDITRAFMLMESFFDEMRKPAEDLGPAGFFESSYKTDNPR